MAETAIIRHIGEIIAEATLKEQSRDELAITSHPVERGADITDHAFKLPSMLTLQVGWSAAFLSQTDSSNQQSSILNEISGAIGQFSSILTPLLGARATARLSQVADIAAGVSGGSSAQQLNALYNEASSIAREYGNPAITTALSVAFQALKLNSKVPSNGSGDGAQALRDLYDQLLLMQSSVALLEVQTGKRLYKDMLIRALTTETDQTTENVLLVTIQLQEVILVETLQTTMPANGDRATPQSTSGIADTGTKATVPSPPL